MHIKDTAPIFIISSARSGSKLLRELLANSGEFTYYPYDVNYIWKYGNHHVPHDALSVDHLDTRKIEYIRGYFRRIEQDGKRLLEKTVSNALRLDFVKAIFPDAKFIHLIRDGREVTASLKQCWTEPNFTSRNQSWSLLARKLVDFPWLSSFPYLMYYLGNNISFLANGGRLRSWGPRFEGIDEMLASASLIEVCARQWTLSVSSSLTYFDRQAITDYVVIRYEDIVFSPRQALMDANQYLRLINIEEVCNNAEKIVRVHNSSSWQTILDKEERDRALPILSEYLGRLGYE